MVDTGDLKSLARKGVRVQVPPRAPGALAQSLTPCAGLPVSRCTGSGLVVTAFLGTSPARGTFALSLWVGFIKAPTNALVFLPRF